MITTEDINKIRQQVTAKQINKGKITTDTIEGIRQQLAQRQAAQQPPIEQPVVQQPVQPTTSQPTFANHGAIAQQAHNNVAQRQTTIANNVTKPMTSYLQNGGKIDINDTASLAQLAREQGIPSQQIAQATQNTNNQGIGGIANRIGTEIKNNNLFDDVNTSKYFEYENKLEDAKARGNAVDTAVYQNLIDRMDEDYKPKTKNWYSGKQNLQEHEQNIGTTIDILKYYEDKVLNAKTPEEVQEYLPKYQQEYKNYQNAVSRYQDAKLYNKYNGNPVLDELDILGYTGASTLSGILDETIENVHNDSEVLRGKSFDYIKPSELIKENNARKNGTIPANLQRLSLSMNALREQATRENATDDLKNLYEQIMNGTYTGTEEDIQRVLDNAKDEKYKLEAKENVNTKLRQKKEEFDYNYQPSPAMKYVLENGLEQVIGMTPIYAANLVSPFLGDAAMYQSAANSAYDRARENGATASQARANKTLSGLAEAGFEHLVQSSIDAGFERGGLLKPTEWAENIANPWLRTGVGVGVDVTGEGLEEVASEVTQPIIDRITYDPNAKMATVEEVWGAFTGSILPTLIMQGAGYTLQKVDTFVDKVTSNINNSNLTDLQKAELINQVENGRKEILKQIEQRKQEIDTQAKQTNQNNQIARDTEALNLQPQQTSAETMQRNIENSTQNKTITEKVKDLNKLGYNIPQSTANTLQAIQDVRGTRIEFDNTIDGNGVYDAKNRIVYLNPNSSRAIEFTIAHELGHDIKAGNLADYQELQKSVLAYAEKQKNFGISKQALDNTYKSKLGEGNYVIEDEMTNDILGEVLGNQEFLDSLAQEKPNLFQKVWNWVKNVLLDNTNGRLSFNERRLLNKYEQGFRNAYQKAFSGTQQEGTQQSLSDVTDSQGRQLTVDQENYFKDSKVRDDNGNLETVYHTTTDAIQQFNVFDPRGTDFYRFGDDVVNYFTNSKKMSSSYAHGQFENADTSKNRVEKNLTEEAIEEAKTKYGNGFEFEPSTETDILGLPYDVINVYTNKNGSRTLIASEKIESLTKRTRHKYQYEGYINIKNPYIVDAKGEQWNQIKEGLTPAGERLKAEYNQLNEENLLYTIKRIFDNADYQARENSSKFQEMLYNLDWFQQRIAWEYAREGNLDKLSQHNWALDENDKKILEQHKNDIIDGKTLEEIGLLAYNQRDRLFEKEVKKIKEEHPKIAHISTNDLTNISTMYMGGLEQIEHDYAKETSTNDIVKKVLEMNKQGKDYDGVIIQNVVDYGGKSDTYEPANVYVTFNSNQFKNTDNLNPTDNEDIRYQKSNGTWQQFLDDTYGKWNTGTRTNFTKTDTTMLPSNEELQEQENKGVNAILKDLKIPTNEELQRAETKAIENDAKALNMISEEEYLKAPKNTIDGDRFDYAEHDKKLQQQIEKQVLDAIGNDFNRDTLLKRLQEASKIADKKRNIDTITNADEDQVTVNHRVRTILDDFIRDIKQGYDIRDSLVYKMFTDKSYNIPDTGKKEYEQPPNKISANRPLDELRDFKKVGDRKVNAYQYDNPEVKPFFQQEAKNMLYDLNNAIKGERTATWDDYGELHYSGVTRETVQDIADLLDGKNGVKLSYADIEKGLNAIIEDKGSENIAAAKRIEMVLDKRLREGYTDSYGTEYEPNDNYLNFLAGKDFIDPAEYDKQVQDKLISDYEAQNDDGTLFSLSEEQQKEVSDYVDKIYEDNTLDEEFRDRIAKRLNSVDNYSKFEDIKQEVEDYKDKMYKGISGLEDIANLKPEDVKQREMTYKQRKDKNTTNQRKFFENAETSPIIAEQTKNNVNATTYEQKANLDTLEEVRQKLDERGNDLVEEWKSKQKNFTSKDVALGAILIERYQQEGDWQSAARTVEKLADMGTEAGRAVQMYSIFQRLSPETMAIYQQKALDKAFEEMKQRKTGKWVEANKDKYKLTAEDTQFIYEQVEKASQAVDEETKQRELSKIENRINEKLPPEDGQTIKALRRIAMLLNPKTQVRNVVGNTIITPVNDVADFIGTQLDKAIAKITGVRTTNNPNFVTKAKGFKKGVIDAYTDYKTGTRTAPTGSKYEFDIGAKAFNENTKSKALNNINRKLNGINDFLSAFMSGGDRPFYEAAYQNSLEGQMKANNVTEPTQDMIDIAVNEALQRTWNDDNAYTQTVLGIRRAMNAINIHGFGLGDLIIPFAKTPANLTKAMVEYSPVGFLEAAYDFNDMRKAISRGEMTPAQQKRFVTSTSKAIAGTIIYLIAGTLAKSGRITGSADDDKDVKNFEQNVLGIQPYSVKWGDKTYTYSWANPINAPLAIMADTYKMSKEDANKWDILKNAFKVAGETLVDNSFLQGIKELFSKDSITEGLVEAVESFPESLVPTLFSQIASLGDEKQRQTFEYQNDFKTISNKIKNKLPGARNTLEPQVNTFGEEIENQNTAFNAFLNPANVREARITDEQKALYDVYQETKDKTIFPMQAPYYTNTDNGEKKNLSSKDRVDYQKASGKYVNDIYKDLFQNDRFIGSSNEEKVKILHEIATDGNTKGREAVGAIETSTNSNLSKLNEKIETLEDAGIPLADFYIAWYAKNNHALGKTHTAQKKAIRDYTDLSAKQEEVLYEIFNIK